MILSAGLIILSGIVSGFVGFEQGYYKGYDIGYLDGFESGGYQEGYSIGYELARDSIHSNYNKIHTDYKNGYINEKSTKPTSKLINCSAYHFTPSVFSSSLQSISTPSPVSFLIASSQVIT
mgnify:CR=1 FL=1